MLTSSGTSDIVIVGSDVTLTCTLVLNSAIVVSDLSLLMVDAQLSRDGTPLTLSGRTITGIVYTYITQLNSFGRSDSGNYTCIATVRPQQTSTYLTGNETMSSIISIKAGKCSFNLSLYFNRSTMFQSNNDITLQLLLLLSMFKPPSPVPLAQWRSAGVLHLMEMLLSLDTGSTTAMGRVCWCLQ